MKTKTDLRTIMKTGGELERFNDRMNAVVIAEQNSNDDYDSACYLSLTRQAVGQNRRTFYRVSGGGKVFREGIYDLLNSLPDLIPIFEEAVKTAKSTQGNQSKMSYSKSARCVERKEPRKESNRTLVDDIKYHLQELNDAVLKAREAGVTVEIQNNKQPALRMCDRYLVADICEQIKY